MRLLDAYLLRRTHPSQRRREPACGGHMDKLSQANKDKVIDVLSERLQFERSGVKLYDAVIQKMRSSREPAVAKMLDQMQEHRDQEKEHEEWLEECIRQLGGDAKQLTEKAKLVTQESKGI